MKDRLTRRQLEIFRFLEESIRISGFLPSVREVARHFGFASPSSAEKHLTALERKGLIRRHHGAARKIELLVESTPKKQPGSEERIPILGRIPAGSALLAVEDFVDFISLGETFGDPSRLFALRVNGDSMIKAGIFDGDYVVVRQQPTVSNGEIAVVYLGEDCEATVKRVFFKKNGISLEPESDAFSPTVVPRDDRFFRFGGKVIGLIRRF